MSDAIRDAIGHGKGNYLSTAYWALSTEPVSRLCIPTHHPRDLRVPALTDDSGGAAMR